MQETIKYVHAVDHVIAEPFRHFSDIDVAKIEDFPGMLSLVERKLLYHLAESWYLGEGTIIDGGSFFGSSVCALAAGLRKNPGYKKISENFARVNRKPIGAFELGYLPAPKDKTADRRRVFRGLEYYQGDSFVHILQQATDQFREDIDLRIGDFMNETWDSGKKIEICFIDHAKTKELNAHISKHLYPNLIPSKSYLIHQDFYFDRLPWIKTTMGYLEEYFEWLGQVGTSSIYRCVKQIPQEVCNYDPYTMGDSTEKFSLHRRACRAELNRKRLFMVEISYCYLLALCGLKEDALEKLDDLESEFPDQNIPVGPRGVIRLQRARNQIHRGTMNM